MDLVPITKSKIDIKRWLIRKIKYDEELITEDILNEMCYYILDWINKLPEYELNTDIITFRNKFKFMIYEKYLN